MSRITTALLVAAVAGAAGWWMTRRDSPAGSEVAEAAQPAPSPTAETASRSIDPKMVIKPDTNVDPKMVVQMPNVDPKMAINPSAPRLSRDEPPPTPRRQ